MLTNIFANTAPDYWSHGLPVIPLRMQDKKPAIGAWSAFCKRMPSDAEQNHWLTEFPHGNIGLPLGPASGLVMLDIDAEDQTVINAILDVLAPFPCPWKRIGKKGMALAYKQPVGGELKPFKLKAADTGQMLLECLSTGNQVVLPPSIHPETKRPYEANCKLIEVLPQLVPLPNDIEERMRNCLEALGFKLSLSGMGGMTEFVATGNRDNQMTRNAGIYAMAVTRGERTLLEAIGEMTTWVEEFTQQTPGDKMDPRKAVQSMLGFLTRDVMVGKRPLPVGWDEGLTPEMKKEMGLQFGDEEVEWDYETLIQYLQSQHEVHGAMSQGWNKAVEYALDRISRSPSMSEIAKEQLLKYINDATGGRITVGVLRKQLKERSSGDIKGTDHTEIAQAALDHLAQYGEIRYSQGQFWQFTGSHWEPTDDEDILRLVSSRYGHLQAANRRNHHVGIKATMATLARKELRTLNLKGVNFVNGFLSDEMNLLQHDKEFGCTYTLPYRYLPDQVECPPMFHGFLTRCFVGDKDIEDKIKAVQEGIAVTMFGLGPTYTRAILLFGPGRTGKSELLRIIEALLPSEVVSHVKPDQLRDKFGPAELTGKLLNVAGELSNTKTIAGDIFKQVIAGDGMNVQYKHQPAFEMIPIATHWFASNHLPKSADDTDGFTRRWLILRFEHPIRQEETIPNIARRIVMAEREQIVSWAMQAIPRLGMQRGFTLPSSHQYWLQEIANQNNAVRLFLTESGLVQLPSAPVTGENLEGYPYLTDLQLFKLYSGYCLTHAGDAQRASLSAFNTRMKMLAFELNFRMAMVETMPGVKEKRYYNLTTAPNVKAA